MLTKLQVYSAWPSAPTVLLSDDGRPDTDLVQIRNIDGLDPVKASVQTSPRGAVDGESYTGSTVPSRNIVLTISGNPDWGDWTYESLRRLMYLYFMPKLLVQLVFTSDDMVPVQIFGIVESCTVNQFSKDPELQVSIICTDPYFTAVESITVEGSGEPVPIDYGGDIETGYYIKVTNDGEDTPSWIKIQRFTVDVPLESGVYVEMSSVAMQKYIQSVNLSTGVITNLLSNVRDDSIWPTLIPGDNSILVTVDFGVPNWELIYFERFGGL